MITIHEANSSDESSHCHSTYIIIIIIIITIITMAALYLPGHHCSKVSRVRGQVKVRDNWGGDSKAQRATA